MVNHAAGRGDSLHAIPYEAVIKNLDVTMSRVRSIIAALVKQNELCKMNQQQPRTNQHGG